MTGILKHVLVATDGSDNANQAVSFAFAVAQRHGSELLLCSVVDRAAAVAECASANGVADLALLITALEEFAASTLSAAQKRATDAGLAATTTVLDGRTAEAIVACATQRRAGAIIMGTRGKGGLEQFFLGSTADGVLRAADVPVFVVPAGAGSGQSAFDRIVVALDDSEPSDAAAAFALSLAEADGAGLVFCGVAESADLLNKAATYGYDPTSLLAQLRAAAAAPLARHTQRAMDNDVATESVVAEGNPAETILATARAQQAGLIVVGTHGRRGLRRLFLGSVAERIVRHSPVPVVVVRGSNLRPGRPAEPALVTTAAR